MDIGTLNCTHHNTEDNSLTQMLQQFCASHCNESKCNLSVNMSHFA